MPSGGWRCWSFAPPALGTTVCPTITARGERPPRVLRKWVWAVNCVLARSPAKEGRVAVTPVRVTVAAFSCQSLHRLLCYRETLHPSSSPSRGCPHSMGGGDRGCQWAISAPGHLLSSAEIVRFASWLSPLCSTLFPLPPAHTPNSTFCLTVLPENPKWDKSTFCRNKDKWIFTVRQPPSLILLAKTVNCPSDSESPFAF